MAPSHPALPKKLSLMTSEPELDPAAVAAFHASLGRDFVLSDAARGELTAIARAAVHGGVTEAYAACSRVLADPEWVSSRKVEAPATPVKPDLSGETITQLMVRTRAGDVDAKAELARRNGRGGTGR